ncbi:MAG: hypothetical protein FWD21_04730 [Peptococcaceae bacterium]|nr:hypothetical protein [Peptococcaceae bacterium]
MPDPGLLEYLDQTIMLERECYTLNQLIEFGESQCTVTQTEPTEPVYPEPPVLPPPPERLQLLIPESKRSNCGKLVRRPLFWLLLAGGCVLCGLVVYIFDLHNLITGTAHGDFVHVWLLLTAFVWMLIFLFYLGLPFYIEQEYLFIMARQGRKQLAADEAAYYAQNAQVRVSYNRQIFELKTQYETALAAAKTRNESAGQIIPALEALQRRFQASQYKLHQTLTQLYAIDRITPKCHNLIALTMLHEYLASGRCDGLDGADGAYSLIKPGTQDHQIIYKMTDIPDDLEPLQAHQHKLYTELTAAQQTITALSQAITDKLNRLAAQPDTPADGDSTKVQPPPSGTDQLEQYFGKLEAINDSAAVYLARHG